MLAAFFQTVKGACTGLSIADATPLAVCENLRIKRHKVFQDVAQSGKSSTGWFYGFKLHAIINHQGEIVAIKLMAGIVAYCLQAVKPRIKLRDCRGAVSVT